MIAPDKIWAYTYDNYQEDGSWTYDLHPWQETIPLPILATEYTRTDIAESEHRSGYELARAKAAELGAHIVAYDVAMNK